MKKTRRHRKKLKQRQKGGMFGTSTQKSNQGPSVVQTLRTMFTYGISAILVGPLYLLAEFLNLPLNNLNNISKKAFQDEKYDFLHIPIHKMVTGCKVKQLEPDDFALQDDMYIHNNVAVVSCDKKGKNGEVEPYGTSTSDSVRNFFGLLGKDSQLKHQVFSLFQYIENIRETDKGRKDHIQKLISKVSDYKVLMKCYLIYKSIKNQCPKIKANTKTILKDEDVINIVNPYYIPGGTPVSYTKRIGCVYKHLTQKRFGPQDMADCRASCETCTFRNSLSRLSGKYTSLFSTGGCRVSMVKQMINTYYKFLTVRNTGTQPTDEKGVVPYLDTLNVKSNFKGDIPSEKMVLEKFNTFICKYDIISMVQEQIEKRIKEKMQEGYPMHTLLQCLDN